MAKDEPCRHKWKRKRGKGDTTWVCSKCGVEETGRETVLCVVCGLPVPGTGRYLWQEAEVEAQGVCDGTHDPVEVEP